ncbi:class I SAM-dependent methyltransferase [Marinicella rhabdoformis]|uniref:class I SAM-dependent methyltransferase n=1 Tax=Marinicella rhabdoformis TaxID=2580566 RepID=UPI0012AEBF16|nr:class I SAM-dependent methyltransferase [Marinicella rhabdoformis]
MNEISTTRRINKYDYQLSEEEIEQRVHRLKVGGLWKQIGQLQFEFMLRNGLEAHNNLLDIGCGCLRGGVKFIPFLNASNYYGMDINASLLAAAEIEINRANLVDRNPNLMLNSEFEFHKFEVKFDYMISVSVFTHLPVNNIIRCLQRVSENLKPNGKYFSTFFISEKSIELKPICHQPGNIVTHYDQDPFHYSVDEIKRMGSNCGLKTTLIGDWGHPRGQQMVKFEKY